MIAYGFLGESRMPYHSKWEYLPTEAINPETLAIDRMPILDVVDQMIAEDRKVVAAVQKERVRIAHGVEIISTALKKGGRLFLVGAGTSGRLGVLEAAEMPPTFGTVPTLVQGIMAGGQEAVFRAREGVEDNFEEGARSMARLRISKRDVVIGVSASGITQFVRGALTGARKKNARIIFVTCWPATELQNFVDLLIAPAVGPEVIAGSTRLKAGTATKMVLNMLTTISMIRMGKTYGNLMVDVQTGSEKLKDRARRILSMVTGVDAPEANHLLRQAKWNVKAAIIMKEADVPYSQALRLLRKSEDSIRDALGKDLDLDLTKAPGRSSESPARQRQP
jgi:N-acetylmuramic acid 6-phosphate etherase